MKRIILLLLCAVMIISMCACGKTASDDEKNEPASSSAAAPEAGAAVAPNGGDEDEAANALGVSDRKASYEVWILEVGPGKLKVVRAVHELLGGSIKTARDIVQNACDYPPQKVKGYDTMEEAESVVESLEYEGAKCEIREVYQ